MTVFSFYPLKDLQTFWREVCYNSYLYSSACKIFSPLSAKIFFLILFFGSLNIMYLDVHLCVCVCVFRLGFSELLRTVVWWLLLFLENSQLKYFFYPILSPFGIHIIHIIDDLIPSDCSWIVCSVCIFPLCFPVCVCCWVIILTVFNHWFFSCVECTDESIAAAPSPAFFYLSRISLFFLVYSSNLSLIHISLPFSLLGIV